MSSPTWQNGSSAVADQTSLRRANLGLVLRSLRDRGPRSRARLAADLGLNKATVSSLVGELIERGLAREGSPERGAVRSEEHTSELQSRQYLVCRLLLEKKKQNSSSSEL